jgi:hypothetical protein
VSNCAGHADGSRCKLGVEMIEKIN